MPMPLPSSAAAAAARLANLFLLNAACAAQRNPAHTAAKNREPSTIPACAPGFEFRAARALAPPPPATATGITVEVTLELLLGAKERVEEKEVAAVALGDLLLLLLPDSLLLPLLVLEIAALREPVLVADTLREEERDTVASCVGTPVREVVGREVGVSAFSTWEGEGAAVVLAPLFEEGVAVACMVPVTQPVLVADCDEEADTVLVGDGEDVGSGELLAVVDALLVPAPLIVAPEASGEGEAAADAEEDGETVTLPLPLLLEVALADLKVDGEPLCDFVPKLLREAVCVPLGVEEALLLAETVRRGEVVALLVARGVEDRATDKLGVRVVPAVTVPPKGREDVGVARKGVGLGLPEEEVQKEAEDNSEAVLACDMLMEGEGGMLAEEEEVRVAEGVGV